MATLDAQLQTLMWAARDKTLALMADHYEVDAKTTFNDLVTTVDKETERFITARLKEIDPTAQIISEEGFGDEVHDLSGRVYIVDPVDGTLNFVKQQTNFATMLACYEDGQPKLGYIMDVMNQTLYHGGPGVGVFKNAHPLTPPVDRGLRGSLVDVNYGLLFTNHHNVQAVIKNASGLRLYGSAGLEIINVLEGRLGLYLSRLKPWDLAAGRALAEGLGLVVKAIDEKGLDVLSSNLVLVATKQVADDVFALVN